VSHDPNDFDSETPAGPATDPQIKVDMASLMAALQEHGKMIALLDSRIEAQNHIIRQLAMTIESLLEDFRRFEMTR